MQLLRSSLPVETEAQSAAAGHRTADHAPSPDVSLARFFLARRYFSAASSYLPALRSEASEE